MKTGINILTGIFFAMSFTSCNNFGHSQNSLSGIIYTNISEVPQFKNYKVIDGALLPKHKYFDNKYAIMHISDGIRHVLIFEDITNKDPISLAPKHQIIDTIYIDRIEENESIVFSFCQQDTTVDPNIVALVTQTEGDTEFTEKLVRAWRIDFETKQILPIKNIQGIKCRLAWE